MKNWLTKHIISIELRKKIRLNKGMRTVYNSCKVTRYFLRIKRFMWPRNFGCINDRSVHCKCWLVWAPYKWFKVIPLSHKYT